MKLPINLLNFFKSKPPGNKRSAVLSLAIDVDTISAGFWYVVPKTEPKLIITATQAVNSDSWEERFIAVKATLNQLEQATGITASDTVLGLPHWYLEENGEIKKDTRGELKKLLKKLSLHPLGFVPLDQALIYQLKKEEGVPPNAIFLAFNDAFGVSSLYKIGKLIGRKIWENSAERATDVEIALKSFANVEVLPSRMLLYGGNNKRLEQVKNELLRHPWATRTNFLHFPKIEIIAGDKLLSAVSLAGASEIAGVLEEDIEEVESLAEQDNVAIDTPVAPELTVTAQPSISLEKEEMVVESPAEILEAQGGTDDLLESSGVIDEAVAIAQPPDIVEEEIESQPNFKVVLPEELGFNQRTEPLEMIENHESINEKKEIDIKEKLNFDKLSSLFKNVPKPQLTAIKLKIPSVGGIGAAFGVIVLFVILGIAISWFLPSATITVLILPEQVTASATVIIDPKSTIVDSENFTIPGGKREKTLSSEKVVAATGKKKVGDPAKGTVTIYNKTLGGVNLTKGTTVKTNGLKFTLDSDVRVASGTSDWNGLTYGKANVAITAVNIGTESNLNSGSEFSVGDFQASTLIARNEQPLAGGTSRDVIVVSRADYDSLVLGVTTDLTNQAKTDLSESLGNGEKLIDDTVKSTITEKKFDEELNQEASNVHGKVSLVASGLTYREDDLLNLLKDMGKKNVPEGYNFLDESQSVNIKDVEVKKDGKVTLNAEFVGSATPKLDVDKISSQVIGKKITWVTDYLKSINGIGGAQFGFRWTLWKDRLPSNGKNISIRVAVMD